MSDSRRYTMLCGARACHVLIGDCNPTSCPIHVFRCQWDKCLAKYLKVASTPSADLGFNALDVHYSGVRSEKAFKNIKDPDLLALVQKYCSAPPMHVSFQSAPGVGSKKTHYNPWLPENKLPTSPPHVDRRIASIMDEEDDAEPDDQGWAADFERVSLASSDGVWAGDKTDLLHAKFSVARLRWLWAKCSGTPPEDVQKKPAGETLPAYKARLAADIMSRQDDGRCPSRREEALGNIEARRAGRKTEGVCAAINSPFNFDHCPLSLSLPPPPPPPPSPSCLP